MIPIQILSRQEEAKNPYTGAVAVTVIGKVTTTGQEFKIRFRSNYELKLFQDFCKRPEVTTIAYEGYEIGYTTRKADKNGHWQTVKHTYTPDFVINAGSKGMVIIEAKGKFDAENQRKFSAIRKQYPKAKIYFMLKDYTSLIEVRGSTMLLRDWLGEHGYDYGWGYKIPASRLHWLDLKYLPKNAGFEPKTSGVMLRG